jgi:hypothetical protein
MSDSDAFRMLRALRVEGTCKTLSIGVLHTDSPARVIKSADMLVDGPTGAKAFIENLLDDLPGFSMVT